MTGTSFNTSSRFWDQHDAATGGHVDILSFRNKWKILAGLTTILAVTPLIILTLFYLDQSRRTIRSEILARTRQQVATASRMISFFLSSSSWNAQELGRLLANLDLGHRGDAFLIDQAGVLQTASRHNGGINTKLPWQVPDDRRQPFVREAEDDDGNQWMIGFAAIQDTPFILTIVKNKSDLMQPWNQSRFKIIVFASISVTLILVCIIGMTAYFVHRIHAADRRRIISLRKAAYDNKMASIGRLSAGVAHELNNPLEIINEKAGLIQDMFHFLPQYREDQKLAGLTRDIIANVHRCGQITNRLLNFATRAGSSMETIDLGTVVADTLAFLNEEAAFREISISQDISDDIPPMQCDRGALQQILLNLFNNSLRALKGGGCLNVMARPLDDDWVCLDVSDTGPGIPPEALAHVFDPFYFQQTDEGGTGLGLSVTYGLVKNMGGQIYTSSQLGKGTCFSIELPITVKTGQLP